MTGQMRYRLIVLTHGDEPDCAEATLDAFAERVTPLPVDTVIVRDGPGYSYIPRWTSDGMMRCLQVAPEQVGFCEATRYAWTLAASPGPDFVFWLEHDFVIEQDVDLTQLAAVLQDEPTLAQMALMRDAVNEQEKVAGGLYESRRDQYVRREHDSVSDYSYKRPITTGLLPHSLDSKVWLEHRAYLTTNPSLMRRAFLQHNPWPDHAAECEGRFGIDLVLRGYSFGVWGDGRPWCRHIGDRTGFGY